MGQEIHQLLDKEKQRIDRYREFIHTEPQDLFDVWDWMAPQPVPPYFREHYQDLREKILDTLNAVYNDGYYIEGSGAQTILNSLERYYQTHLKLKREKK